MPVREKARLLADLKVRIAALGGNGTGVAGSGQRIPLGMPGLDAELSGHGALSGSEGVGQGLAMRGLHEIEAADYRDMGAALGFCAALAVRAYLAKDNAPLLWCQKASSMHEQGTLYGPGLAAFGLDPERLVLAFPRTDEDTLWVLEEALRAGALGGVIGEIEGKAAAYCMTASRRLQLAAEKNGVPLFLFTGHAAGRGRSASAALTRWRVSAAPAREGLYAEYSTMPCWRVDLVRCREGRPGSWLVEWQPQTRSFAAADVSRDLYLSQSKNLTGWGKPARQAG